MKIKFTKSQLVLTFIYFAVFYLGVILSSNAANYYVSPSGLDTNPGTTGSPFKTIVKASQVAAAGDIINVGNGTYTGNFATSKSGTSVSPLTYKSTNKGGAKLVGTAPDICWTNNGAYVIVDGFDISSAGRLGFYNTGTNNTVMNCYVHDIMYGGSPSAGSGGAGLDNIGANWIVHHNVILRIDIAKVSGTSTVQGIYTAGSNALIYDNLVGGVAAYGIHEWHGATTSKIYNNTVFNCTGGILIGAGDSGVLPNGSQNNFVDNNIIANNTSYGIREYSYTGTLTSNNTYRNNLLYNNPSNTMNATGDVVSGTITTNPLFVNYLANGNGNYHLQSGSPAIDKAFTTYVPSTDLDWIARSQGAGYDLGAYEYMLATGIETVSTIENSLILYPNPFQTNFNIKVSSEVILKDAVMKMYDVCGKEVKIVSINSNEETIDRGELQNGIYFYQIINNNKNISKGKLVVQ